MPKRHLLEASICRLGWPASQERKWLIANCVDPQRKSKISSCVICPRKLRMGEILCASDTSQYTSMKTGDFAEVQSRLLVALRRVLYRCLPL